MEDARELLQRQHGARPGHGVASVGQEKAAVLSDGLHMLQTVPRTQHTLHVDVHILWHHVDNDIRIEKDDGLARQSGKGELALVHVFAARRLDEFVIEAVTPDDVDFHDGTQT